MCKVLAGATAAAMALFGGAVAASAAPQSASNSSHPAPNAVVVSAVPSPYGRVLVTSSGLGLYMFSGDAFPFSASNPAQLQLDCTALNTTSTGVPCTTPWPPLLATGPLVAEHGVHQAGLGTVSRNGVTQVAYYGHPLYGFAGNSASNPFAGEDVGAFKGVFWLVSPDGNADPGVARVDTEVSSNGIVLSSQLGGKERSLYLLSYDPQQQTTCLMATGCTAIWPPLLTTDRPQAGPGTNAGLLGVIRRPDGGLQVTYQGHPLYFFAFDLAPGAPAGLTNGEDFADSMADGVWYTVSPDGMPDPGMATVRTETSGTSTILSITSAFTNAPVTLYGFTADSATASACSGSCAQFWPPLLTTTPPVAASGASASMLGMIQRGDGTFQVTYNGHPLYFFSHGLDSGTSGAGVTAFGGTFEVVGADGSMG